MLLWTLVCQFSIYILISLGHVYPGMELLVRMASLCLNFKKTARLFSKVTVPFYILTSSVWGFWFLYILTNNPLAIIWHLIIASLVGVKCCLMVSVCNSPMTDDVECLFMCLFAICKSSLEKVHSDSLSCLFILELEEFFVYSRYMSLIRYVIWKYVLHSVGYLFTFFKVSFDDKSF